MITLADDNFLLILNHTDRDSSKVELLKINDVGDTLVRKFLALEGYQISGSAIPAGNGIVLVAGLGSQCNATDPSFGFVLIEMDLSLNEKRRKLFFDENLSTIPIGGLKTSQQKLYYFFWDGIYQFDTKFQFRTKYPSFTYLHHKYLVMFGDKVLLKAVSPHSIQLVNLDGTIDTLITRYVIYDLVVDGNDIYISTPDSIIKLDARLKKVGGVSTKSYLPSGGSINSLYVYKDQLIGGDDLYFTRMSLTNLQPIPNTTGRFLYNLPHTFKKGNSHAVISIGTFNLHYCWQPSTSYVYGGDFCCSHGMISEQGIVTDSKLVIDSIWCGTVSRFEDYDEKEFNVDVSVLISNEGVPLKDRFELGIMHNLDTVCENQYFFLKEVNNVSLDSGAAKIFKFKNLKFTAPAVFDSLELVLQTNMLSQDGFYVDLNLDCPEAKITVYKNFIETRQRPEPGKPSPTFSIYPNPVLTELKFEGLLNAGAEFRIYNMAGQLVYQQKVELLDSAFALDVSRLPDALYILQIKNSSFNEVTRFVKM